MKFPQHNESTPLATQAGSLAGSRRGRPERITVSFSRRRGANLLLETGQCAEETLKVKALCKSVTLYCVSVMTFNLRVKKGAENTKYRH